MMTDVTPSTSAVQPEIERNYRWNFLVNSLDGANFWFGMSFFSSTIILPLFVSHFTANPVAIGLIAFLGWAGIFLPQLFVANAVERAPRKKFFPVTLGFFLERLPLLLLPPAVYFLAIRQPLWTLVIFFVLYAWQNIGTGIVVVGWQDMIAKIIPVDKRGRFFGITNFIGNGTGILGALAVPLLLGRFAFPLGYVLAFTIAAAFIFLSWVFLALTREPAVHSSKPAVSQLVYLRSLPAILRRDRNFRMYLLAQIIFSLSGMATGFLVVYAVQHLAPAGCPGGSIYDRPADRAGPGEPVFRLPGRPQGPQTQPGDLLFDEHPVAHPGDHRPRSRVVFRDLLPARRRECRACSSRVFPSYMSSPGAGKSPHLHRPGEYHSGDRRIDRALDRRLAGRSGQLPLDVHPLGRHRNPKLGIAALQRPRAAPKEIPGRNNG